MSASIDMPTAVPACAESPGSGAIAPLSAEEIDRLIARASRALDRGDVEAATEDLVEARRSAGASGEHALADRAFCTLAAIDIEAGRGDAVVSELRRLLLRSAHQRVCYLAAYHIARSFDLERDFRKATFYARVAIHWAELARQDAWRAAAHNLLGNCFVARSRFAEAQAEFESALALAGDAAPSWRLAITGGIGYCRLMLGSRREALSLLLTNLRAARRIRCRFAAGFERSVSQAFLLLARPADALRHAERALRDALALGDADGERIALILCGEAAAALGDRERQRDSFAAVQEKFYRARPGVAEFLSSLSPTHAVNLNG